MTNPDRMLRRVEAWMATSKAASEVRDHDKEEIVRLETVLKAAGRIPAEDRA